ncbi:hypothetical protein [Paenibacillus sp. FSL H7-689]|uniref:hypothetical protein n=1 Tax=Paenibacillus sp. FSL H7-689 TaxID=1227349 RepID=UPI0004B654D3|nr:hypothetical protein [Paenibacillus sp. FSL H7-689]
MSAPIETQKNLLQIIVKQIRVKKDQKIEGIELEFDDKVNACFLDMPLPPKRSVI